MRYALLGLLFTGGCDGVFQLDTIEPDAPRPIDAPPPVDVCGSQPETAPIRVSGQMHDASNDAPIAGLDVDATPGGNALTGAGGDFAIDVSTNNELLFVSLLTTGVAAYPTHAIHYQRAYTSSMDASSKLLPSTAIESLYGAPAPVGYATALVSLRDCAGNGLGGATITVSQAGSVIYQGGGTSTNGTGVAYALNIQPGAVTVTPSVGRAFEYEAHDGEMAIVYLATP